MIQDPALQRFGRAVLMSGVALFALFMTLTPVYPLGSSGFRPDLLLVVLCIWVLRNPASLPAWLAFAVMLAGDFLMDRPTGLAPVALIAATEALRNQRRQVHDLGFLVEWLCFGAVVLWVEVFTRTLLWATAANQIPVSQSWEQLVATFGVYPLAVLALRYGAGLRWTHIRPGSDGGLI